MRRTLFLILPALLAVPVVAGADTADKQLQSVKGSVSYQHGTAKKPLAANASIVLADKDYAMTGADSRGAVTLPDSSVVTVGSDTKVQLAFFNQTDIANAKFIVYNGKTRFEIRHPQGAKANYVFQTPSAAIAVRGTQGDIGVTPDSLQVNVYEVCDPQLPVIVTTKSGQEFTVNAGQALAAKIVGGIVRAQVEQLTQQMLDQFNTDLGVPTNIAGITGVVTSKVDEATGISGLGSAVGGLFKKKPAPTPSPASATCS